MFADLLDLALRDVRRYVPVFSGMKPGDRVLDVCCGTGAQVIEYERKGMLASGIDISSGMLAIASRNKARQPSSDVAFCLTDAASLPFLDDSFDYVSITSGLHDKERVIRGRIVTEMKRVVKKDGFLIFVDFQVPLPKNVWAMFARTIEFLASGSHYRGFREYLSNGGLNTILEAHQLVEERRDCIKGGILAIVKAKVKDHNGLCN